LIVGDFKMMNYTKLKLAFMMFLQFFIWGAWAVTLGTYLNKALSFEGSQIGIIYGTTAIGAIIAPLFIGFVADRLYSSQYIFAGLHLLGACLLYNVSQSTEFTMVYIGMLAYSLCYMPTLSLANSMSFFHLKNSGKEFPLIRVLGTIGWISAGLLVGFLQFEGSNIPLQISAIASIILGLFSLILPNTPPTNSGATKESVSIKKILGFDAFVLLKDRSFMIVFFCSILVCIPLAFYYSFTNQFLNEVGMENAAAKMTLGQVSEVAFMILMPFFFHRLGVKWMLIIGISAWILRYVLFAISAVEPSTFWMLYLGIALHGICYDFFFVTGQIYADIKAPKHLKNSAQSLMTIGTYGIGMLIGSLSSGWVVSYYTNSSGETAWASVWLIPAIMASLIVFLFAFMFREENTQRPNDL